MASLFLYWENIMSKTKAQLRAEEALRLAKKKINNPNYNVMSGNIEKDKNYQTGKNNRRVTVNDVVNTGSMLVGGPGTKMIAGLGIKALSKFMPKGMFSKIFNKTKSGKTLTAAEKAAKVKAEKLKKLKIKSNNNSSTKINIAEANKGVAEITKKNTNKLKNNKVNNTKVNNTKVNKTKVNNKKVINKKVNKTPPKPGDPKFIGPTKPFQKVTKKSGVGPMPKPSLGSKIGKGLLATAIIGGGSTIAGNMGTGNEVKNKKKLPIKNNPKNKPGNPGTGNEITKGKKKESKAKPKYTGRFVNKKGEVAYDSISSAFSHLIGKPKEKKKPSNVTSRKADKKGATKGVNFSGSSVQKLSMGSQGKIKMAKAYSKGGTVFTGR
jgi:hypothetical protein